MVAKRYAPVTSTRQNGTISESLKHEPYQKFVQKKKKIPSAKIWALVQRNVVLGACMVAANAVWHAVFQRLLEHLLHFQVGRGCSLYLPPKQPFGEMHLSMCKSREWCGVFVWDLCLKAWCASMGTTREEAVCKCPKLGLKSRATLKSRAARRKALKDKGKGKGRVGPIPQSRVSSPGTVGIVPPSEGEDSAA